MVKDKSNISRKKAQKGSIVIPMFFGITISSLIVFLILDILIFQFFSIENLNGLFYLALVIVLLIIIPQAYYESKEISQPKLGSLKFVTILLLFHMVYVTIIIIVGATRGNVIAYGGFAIIGFIIFEIVRVQKNWKILGKY